MSRRFEKAKEYTEKYAVHLAPCRECGNTDIRIVSDRTVFPPKDVWSVVCTTKSCNCTGTFTSVRAAVKHWNAIQNGGAGNA